MRFFTPRRIKDYITGYVRVKIQGKNPERLINLCLSANFPVWDVTVEGQETYFSTSLAKYREIRPLASKARCIPKIVGRTGLPFFVGKIRKRVWFLLAALFMAGVLIYFSGSVWTIVVRGNETLSREKLLNAAAGAGLTPGARKSRVFASEVEYRLLTEYPILSWAYVRFQGTVALIEVVEKARAEPVVLGDIVARTDGLIQSVLVHSGTPHVTPGQTVKKGDVLISGDQEGNPARGARGSVLAQTWYEVYIEVPLTCLVPRRTGDKVEIRLLRINGREIPLMGVKRIFDWYEIEDTTVTSLSVGQIGLTMVNRVFYEVKWEQREISLDEAKNIAESRVRESMEKRLPYSVKLVDWNCQIEVEHNSLVVVRGHFSIIEDIGEIRPW